MEDNSKCFEFSDVRIMTLKRWNLPQTEHVFGENFNRNKQLGQYVSYCTHHFIDIHSAVDAEEHTTPSLAGAYQQLKKRREEMNAMKQTIHTVQSMTLAGPKTEFWTKKAEVLFITFVQLSTHEIENFNEIQQEIAKSLSKHCSHNSAPKPDFALYYSYDFCDMVLFTKNIQLTQLHNALWDISLIRTGAFLNIRDTFTICSFGWDFLKNCFQHFSQQPNDMNTVLWDDTFSISVNLSVQSLKSWDQLKAALAPIVNITDYRLPGRYDINFTTELISGSHILRIIYEIDKLCVSDVTKTFGGYEIIFRAEHWTRDDESGDASVSSDLRYAMEATLDQLCPQYHKAFPEVSDYLYETKRSLEELSKNGFSDEFILSVIPSFISYLKIGLECAQRDDYVWDSVENMRKEYYTALNTLSLCTMHNERQFIQAPSFNASYFEIPPKLLAFFSAVAFDISLILSASHEQGEIAAENLSPSYHFIISPDYRNDIHVKPLLIDGSFDTSEHLAIINLSERYFYEPQKTIMLLAHEIGHFVGDRKRRDRARLIFKAISLLLLNLGSIRKTFTPETSVITDNDIGGLFSDVLATYLLSVAEETVAPSRGIKFLLNDIKEFLLELDFGIAIFTDDRMQGEIEELWKEALKTKLHNENHTGKYNRQLIQGLQVMQSGVGSQYLARAAEVHVTENIIDIFCKNVASSIHNLQYEFNEFNRTCHDKRNGFIENCYDVFDAFSEAYADLRMYEICDSAFRLDDYESLLSEVSTGSNYVNDLRYDVIQRFAKSNNTVTWNNHKRHNVEGNNVIHATITEYVIEYLELCRNSKVRSNVAKNALLAFQKTDLFSQCALIDAYIAEYRKILIEFCNKNRTIK